MLPPRKNLCGCPCGMVLLTWMKVPYSSEKKLIYCTNYQHLYSQCPTILCINLFSTLLRLVMFEDFMPKNVLHMALRKRNFGTESSRELLKGSKDTASLPVCTRKKFLVGECGFFMSDVISGGLLGHIGPLHLALGPYC